MCKVATPLQRGAERLCTEQTVLPVLMYEPVKELCVDSKYRSSFLNTDFHTYANLKAWKRGTGGQHI